MSHCQLEIIVAKTGHPLQVLPTLLQRMGNSMIFSPFSKLQTSPSSPARSFFFTFSPGKSTPCVMYLQPQLLHTLGFTFANSPPSSLSTTGPSTWAELIFLSSCFGHITLVPFIGHEHFHHSQLSHPPSPDMLSLTHHSPHKAIKLSSVTLIALMQSTN